MGNILKTSKSVHGTTIYDSVGSICGSGYGIIRNCYNIASITLQDSYCGLSGYWGISIINSYTDCDNMKNKTTYNGWDFYDVWEIDEGNDFPRLRINASYFLDGD